MSRAYYLALINGATYLGATAAVVLLHRREHGASPGGAGTMWWGPRLWLWLRTAALAPAAAGAAPVARAG
jgi:hypothetical protein